MACLADLLNIQHVPTAKVHLSKHYDSHIVIQRCKDVLPLNKVQLYMLA